MCVFRLYEWGFDLFNLPSKLEQNLAKGYTNGLKVTFQVALKEIQYRVR